MSAGDAIEEVPEAVLAALATPAFHAARPVRVEHVQTHISHVFLAGDDVYKLKKAVRFSFLDFGTRARRRFFCAEELRLNRRLAAPVYLDVVEVVRRADGSLALGGAGAPVEPVLHMRRLPAERLLPALLAAGAVDASMMTALARRIAAFHREAPRGPSVAAEGSPEAVRRRFADTLATLRPFVGRVLFAEEHAALLATAEWFVRTRAPLLRARQAEGRIREGHGDLHAEHVCFVPAGSGCGLPEGIYVFDCIEFSAPFRCNDVASEIAFLTMDLEARGRRDLADAFAAAYAEAADDPAIPRLVPYYAAYRAAVRAMVAALTEAEPEMDAAERQGARARAAAYVALALRSAWRAYAPAVIVCCGRSGTGKSTIAAGLAESIEAEVLRSDVIRKRADRPGAAAPPDRYGAPARAAIYAALCREVDAALAADRTVIADATFLRRAERDAVAAVAARHGRRVLFVETTAEPETVRARLAARPAGDVSDARFDTYRAQAAEAEPWGPGEPRVTIGTEGEAAAVRAAALGALFAWRADGAD
ncbi:MAG: AAA family ATPase [Deltaproteobacteria bacterium]|nr:AAA family ATPase [Deltaproteobacteria bacterium]